MTLGGLVGSCLLLPMRIPREAVRRQGQHDLRLGGEDLADFVEIVAGIDDHWVEQGETTLLDRLRERARELRDAPPAFTLPPEVLGELNDRLRAAGGPVLSA